MLSEKMQKAFNDQINAELYSAYLYQSMAAYFQAENWPGMANWMKTQAMEEVTHAQKFFDFINERGGRVTLAAIDAPPTDWDGPLAAFQDARAHEQKVTGLINDLVAAAREENDNAAEIFLQWFVTEQVEEEASVDEIVQMLDRIKNAPQGLFMLDRQLGARTFGGGD